MPNIPFIKASACGNDFLLVNVVDAVRAAGAIDLQELTRRMCDRHQGIGADGVEWMARDEQGEMRIRLVNADGSPAELSGNGTRCVAAYMVSEQPCERIAIQTDAGLKTCTFIARDGNRFEFETDMGEPQVGEAFSIRLAFGEVTGIPLSMGNPHFVLFKNEFGPGWQAEAAEIGRHHDFKFGVNVELVRIENANAISALFFERGAGETQSSGTGSCAAAVAAIYSGRTRSPVEVRAPGGAQTVRWEDHVFLRGPATLVCRGEYFV